MPDSIATITAQLKTDYPQPQYSYVNGENSVMATAEYNAWIDRQAQNIQAKQIEDEAGVVEKGIRSQLLAGIQKLDDNYTALSGGGAVTSAQQRSMLADVTRAASMTLKMLRKAKLFEDFT